MSELPYLGQLESESLYIFREAAASFQKPVMLYSVGKDSSVLLHLALKAFYPEKPPFPLLHIDTTWKFREMLDFRNRRVAECGVELMVHTNQEGKDRGLNPFDHESSLYTRLMKTEALKQALNTNGFDAAIGGARRDEEKSRAKERVFSVRSAAHRWDPKIQRPEFWHLYNTELQNGDTMRIFPLSNWTELDIWLYIQAENIPVVPLYFAADRPVVERDGTLLVVDDERFPFREGETPVTRRVRFRTLGCYPLTAAIESEADTLEKVIQETVSIDGSERRGRIIDRNPADSFERLKQDGYF